jgi:hypothetical protein
MKKTLLFVLALIAVGCGPPDGPFEEYYENGQLWVKGTLAAGELDEPGEVYYENGQLEQKGTYAAGELDEPGEGLLRERSVAAEEQLHGW